MIERFNHFFRTVKYPRGIIIFLKLVQLLVGIMFILMNLLKVGDTWNAFTLFIALMSMSMAMESHNMALNRKDIREFSEFFPSRELDKLIFDEYSKRCKEMGLLPSAKESARFTTVPKDADILRRLVTTQCTVEENIAKQLYKCEYTYNEKISSATCETREMAICIAFLRSCSHKSVSEETI